MRRGPRDEDGARGRVRDGVAEELVEDGGDGEGRKWYLDVDASTWRLWQKRAWKKLQVPKE